MKRLHKVHYSYPNTSRRIGKTTYCYDMLLRSAQTEKYKNLSYVTSSIDQSFNDFTEFLDNLGETYTITNEGVVTLYNSNIIFSSPNSDLKGKIDGFIEDYPEEDTVAPQWRLDEIEDWSKRQLTRSVYKNL